MLKVLILLLMLNGFGTNKQNFRVDYATYYDYLTLVTTDGNEWLLEESEDENVQYEENEKLICIFDTKGTLNVEDDEIIFLESLSN